MTCRACKRDHSPMEDCRVFARRMGLEALRNQPVTTVTVICNQCVTKDEEIERLRNQIREMESRNRAKPKRDRAQYMRKYRAGGVSETSLAEKGTPQ